MKVISKIFGTLLLLIIGAFLSWFFNFYILYPILIPDPEKYAVEGGPTSKLFFVFFEISSNTGYHPEPTRFYIYLAYLIGIIFGAWMAYKIIWNHYDKPTQTENATT